jgi:hypothetical protein
MEICNIIKSNDNVISEVISFVIEPNLSEDQKNEIVTLAEKCFEVLILEELSDNSFLDDLSEISEFKENLETYLNDGFYGRTNWNCQIAWSNRVH